LKEGYIRVGAYYLFMEKIQKAIANGDIWESEKFSEMGGKYELAIGGKYNPSEECKCYYADDCRILIKVSGPYDSIVSLVHNEPYAIGERIK